MKNQEIAKQRSRSRSRDKDNKMEKYKLLILKQYESIGGSTNVNNWSKKDQQILKEVLEEKGTDEEIVKQFFTKKLHFKKNVDLEGQNDLSYEQYLEKQEQFHSEQELIRAFFRMEQGRELPIDKYIKIVYIYKGKLKLEKNSLILKIMKSPKEFLEQLQIQQLKAMIPQAEVHQKVDIRSKTPFIQFWRALIQLIQIQIESKSNVQAATKPQIQQRIDKIMNKQLPDLLKTQKSILATQTQNSMNNNSQFWQNILKRIKIRKLEHTLVQFFNKFKDTNTENNQNDSDQQEKIVTSPILLSKDIVQAKFLVTEEQQIAERTKIAEKIFKEDFEKSIQKLENNLSLPKNHNLLQETNIITDVNTTYDYIAEEILEFERYKRLEEDQEDFNDWLPVQTEGRFRNQRPVYVNRVRMAFEWNRYNQQHYDSENPPPKTVQGYKFNIFYPHLLDKTKTPQYYLQPTESNDFAIIKFKVGPPYLDIAFKIVNRQWDFTQKSGFQSIFAKGILHLYFNFKKPRYRI